MTGINAIDLSLKWMGSFQHRINFGAVIGFSDAVDRQRQRQRMTADECEYFIKLLRCRSALHFGRTDNFSNVKPRKSGHLYTPLGLLHFISNRRNYLLQLVGLAAKRKENAIGNLLGVWQH